MTIRHVVFRQGNNTRLIDDRALGRGAVQCWCGTHACHDACAAFYLNENEVHCLALPVLAAQCIARLVESKKTLLDAHAEAVEAAERDEAEEDKAANEALDEEDRRGQTEEEHDE